MTEVPALIVLKNLETVPCNEIAVATLNASLVIGNIPPIALVSPHDRRQLK